MQYCYVSVGAHVAGIGTVGTGTWIGTGTTVSDHNVEVCGEDMIMIGAGAVVVKDIKNSGTYVECPTKKIG